MSLLKDIWSAVSGIGKGMEKTYDEQFDPVFTEMYPFVQPQLPPVSVQSLALIKNEDGSDRCVSCLACEKVCPSQVITIERKRNPVGKGFVLERFDIDLVNCMYCAACVESCPAQAIVTIQDFEMSTPNLQTLKADKDFLDFQGLRARQWYSPKVGVEYREEDTENPVHGKIVKAPIEEQPGGLQEMEKARLAALTPSAPGTTGATEPAKPAVEAPAAPKAAVSSEAPKAEAAISSPAPEAPKAEAAPVETPKPAPEPTPVVSSSTDTVADAKPETPSQTVSSGATDASKADDLSIIEGIGPKRAEALNKAGITTFAALAGTDRARLEEIMTGAGLSLEPGIETWPVQADLLARGDTTGFNALTVSLIAGRVSNDKPKNPKAKRWEPKKPGDG